MKKFTAMILSVAMLFLMALGMNGSVAYAATPSAEQCNQTLSNLQSTYPDWSKWDSSYKNLAWQCHGFALTVFDALFGVNANSLGKSYNVDDLYIGDLIRFHNSGWEHSLIVTDISGDTITYVDCNGDNRNTVRWNKTISRSRIKSNLIYIKHQPGNNLKSRNAVASGNFVDLTEGIYRIGCEGFYVNVPYGTDKDGTKCNVWQGDNSTEESFRIVPLGNGLHRIYAMCSSNGTNRVLDVYRGSSATAPLKIGQAVDIWPANDTDAQTWKIYDVGNGKYRIELAFIANSALTSGGNWNNGSLTIQSYNGIRQQWSIEKIGDVSHVGDANIAEGTYTISSGGYYVNVPYGTDRDGVKCNVWEKDGSNEEKFRILPLGNGLYRIYAICSSSGGNRVLDVYRGNSATAPLNLGQPIDIWSANDAAAQTWKIVRLEDGSCQIILADLPDSALTSGGTWNNASLTIQKYTGDNLQKWQITAV